MMAFPESFVLLPFLRNNFHDQSNSTPRYIKIEMIDRSKNRRDMQPDRQSTANASVEMNMHVGDDRTNTSLQPSSQGARVSDPSTEGYQKTNTNLAKPRPKTSARGAISHRGNADNVRKSQSSQRQTGNSIAFQLPHGKQQHSPSSKSNDSTSTVESTSAWHETSHNSDTEPANAEHGCTVGITESTNASCYYENDVNDNRVDASQRNRRSRRRMSRKRRKPHMNVADLIEASTRISRQEENDAELWKSKPAIWLYALVVISVSLRRFLLFQGISILFVYYFIKLLLSWFMYVKDAKEIREFYGLAKWWINFGLRFSTKTIEGDKLHSILTAFTVNFWKGTGFNYATSLYQSIAKDGRDKFLQQARDNLKRTQSAHLKFKIMLQNQRRSK
jgi:hypothetical protein